MARTMKGREAGVAVSSYKRVSKGSDSTVAGARQSVRGLRELASGVERALLASNEGARRRLRGLAGRWQQLDAALADTYRWGRKAMAAAYSGNDAVTARRDDAFCEWRRAVSYHRCHVRLLAELWPEQLAGRLEVLDRLSELLAEDGQLQLLAATITVSEEPDRTARLAVIAERQQALRAMARPLSKRIYGERVTVLARRLRGYWQATVGASTERRFSLVDAWRPFVPVWRLPAMRMS